MPSFDGNELSYEDWRLCLDLWALNHAHLSGGRKGGLLVGSLETGVQGFVLTRMTVEEAGPCGCVDRIRALLDERFRRPNEARAAAAFEKLIGYRRG